MKVKRPLLVTFITDLNVLNIFLVIISFFPKFIEQFGVYAIPISKSNSLNDIIRILEVICLIIISYGFFKLKKYGYWLMISYNLFFLALSMFCLETQNEQLNLRSEFMPSLIALIITFPSKRYFMKEIESL
ncbi:hypothetical protein [Clostridium sp.]|uniref:hypothetical protein n=1 Tax=Clostridium sp. TaxID=1506 RepID=UPI00284244E9|nr:hypothetical protein [Clostridium sp.]MDR3598058.1 hypothetical protein [Clostridium sp.]